MTLNVAAPADRGELVRSFDDIRRARVPHAVLLSNGTMASLVTDAGAGFSIRGALALTRWSADRTRDADGQWLYIRDETGARWTAGAQPAAVTPDRYEAALSPGSVVLEREDHGITSRTEICVAPDDPVELRRYTFTNNSERVRRLTLSTYLELVLNAPAADASHPAFSKLFVQTAYRSDSATLVAWRRQRSPEDELLCLAHRLVGVGASDSIEHETDRARFLGRGRDTRSPRALDPGVHLSGTTGNVLDPIFSLRRTIQLEPDQSVQMLSVLSAHEDQNEAVSLATRFGDPLVAEEAARAARARGRSIAESTGALQKWSRIPELIGHAAYLGIPTHLDDRTRRDDRALLAALSRAEPIPAASPALLTQDARGKTRRETVPPMPPRASADPLLMPNGHGGFSANGDEYVIRIDPRAETPLPPLPWTNVVANDRLGFVVSETGAGYTWCLNSRENRLTPWYNDPVTDPHGEAFYLRDESGEHWSPLPGPAPSSSSYEARHGIGYSRWQHVHAGLEQDVAMYVPSRDTVKIVRLRVTNRGGRARRLSAFAFVRWMLGGNAMESARTVETAYDAASGAVLATNRARAEFASRIAFAAVAAPAAATVSQTGDGAAFLGRHGNLDAPAAVVSGGPLDGRFGGGLDPCAAFRVMLTLEKDATAEYLFLLGEAATVEETRELIARYRTAGAAEGALNEVRAFWQTLRGGVRVETPSPAIDVMVNHWLPYQNLSCRIWGRSAFYQSGGAFGFRDQLQDSAAMVYLLPALTRAQIVLHASHQFVEGDVLHWWHPPLSKGIRTRFSDDLLWLPYVTTFYVGATGDSSVLDERARFLRGPLLDQGEDERFILSEDSGESGTVYEHCARAIDRSLTRGEHGLPLMGAGDWNDGMNRVGHEGRGESVWLGFFLADVLHAFIPLCDSRNDAKRAARYREYRATLVTALNAQGAGWDGAWYRRAYYDDGTPLGSASSDECRIDAIAQAWSVISGVAPRDRAERALDAMEKHLVSEAEGLIRLLTPAFDRTPHDPGYIKGYLPGVRENGGQYTHGALWAVRALAEFGRHERAARLLTMLSPVSHGDSPERIAVYRAEPYVIAADVYGVSPHVGRAGWTWYTGSAGWMYRVALESVLGFSIEGGRELVLRPCIPDAWPGFTIRYRIPDSETTYEIRVERAGTDAKTSVRLEGASPACGKPRIEERAVHIPMSTDGRTHRIVVTLGRDLSRQYRERADA